MDVELFLALRIEGERARLAGIAYRLLGDYAEAEEAMHEAWLRAAEQGFDTVDNLSAWLTTLVTRVCLDRLHARCAGGEPAPPPDPHGPAVDSEQESILAEATGLALLVVLDRLSPEERVAYVLHDLFEMDYEEIAPALERPADAVGQLAEQARGRVWGSVSDDPARAERLALVKAFRAASQYGDMPHLLALLDPDAVFIADPARKRIGTCEDVAGAEKVAHAFKGRAQFNEIGLLDGEPGLIVAPRGRILHVLRFTIVDGRIAAIEAIAGAELLAGIELSLVG